MSRPRGYKSKLGGKDQESMQSIITHDPVRHMGKLQNTIKHNIEESQNASSFPACD